MQAFVTKVSAIYPTEQAARTSLESLKHEGFPQEHIHLVGPSPTSQGGMPAATAPDVLEVEEMLKTLKKEVISTGAAAGTGRADIRTLASQEISLFLATPVFQTLAARSQSSILKHPDHAGESANVSAEDFAAIARQAVDAGHWILLTDNRDDQEVARVRTIVERTYG